MLRFIVRRLIVTVPMVLVVVSLTWALIRLAPGNFYTGEKPIPPAIQKNRAAEWARLVSTPYLLLKIADEFDRNTRRRSPTT